MKRSFLAASFLLAVSIAQTELSVIPAFRTNDDDAMC
jgi:hypothetical protein